MPIVKNFSKAEIVHACIAELVGNRGVYSNERLYVSLFTGPKGEEGYKYQIGSFNKTVYVHEHPITDQLVVTESDSSEYKRTDDQRPPQHYGPDEYAKVAERVMEILGQQYEEKGRSSDNLRVVPQDPVEADFLSHLKLNKPMDLDVVFACMYPRPEDPVWQKMLSSLEDIGRIKFVEPNHVMLLEEVK